MMMILSKYLPSTTVMCTITVILLCEGGQARTSGLRFRGGQPAPLPPRTASRSTEMKSAGGLASAAAAAIPKITKGTLNKIFNRENANVVWETIEKSADFLESVRGFVTKRKEAAEDAAAAGIPPPPPLPEFQKHEFMVCQPDDPQEICYSTCERQGKDYHWCHTSSVMSGSAWAVCTCDLRPEIVHWLLVNKQRLMASTAHTTAAGKPPTDLIQWIIIGILAAILLSFSLAFIGRCLYRYLTEQAPRNPGQGIPQAAVRNNIGRFDAVDPAAGTQHRGAVGPQPEAAGFQPA